VPEDAIASYLRSVSAAEAANARKVAGRAAPSEGQPARIVAVRLLGADGAEKEAFRTGEPLTVRVEIEADEPIDKPSVGIAFYGPDGTCFTGTNTLTSGFAIERLVGRDCVSFHLDHLPLLPAVYRIRIDLDDRHMGVIDSVGDAAWLDVVGGAFGAGSFLPAHRWSLGEDV
jgi:hypothetical protein